MNRALLSLLVLSVSAAAAPDAGRLDAREVGSRAKPRVAVLYFDANSTDEGLKAFSKGLAAMVITDLSAGGQLDVVERERLEEVLNELKLGESRFADTSSFARVGKLLGAQYLVVGSIVSLGAKSRLVSRAILTETGQEAASAGVMVDAGDVFAAETELVKKLTDGLLARGVLTAAPPSLPSRAPLPMRAAVKYSRALDAKDKKKPEEAKKLLGEVVAEQPNFELARLDLLSLTR